ncbi:hypothetical protein D3C86_1744450 [compost metagenome]
MSVSTSHWRARSELIDEAMVRVAEKSEYLECAVKRAHFSFPKFGFFLTSAISLSRLSRASRLRSSWVIAIV